MLKRHINIKRREVNIHWQIKASLSENNLIIYIDIAESQNANKMPCREHILVIIVLVYLQNVAILSVAIIPKFRMIIYRCYKKFGSR